MVRQLHSIFEAPSNFCILNPELSLLSWLTKLLSDYASSKLSPCKTGGGRHFLYLKTNLLTSTLSLWNWFSYSFVHVSPPDWRLCLYLDKSECLFILHSSSQRHYRLESKAIVKYITTLLSIFNLIMKLQTSNCFVCCFHFNKLHHTNSNYYNAIHTIYCVTEHQNTELKWLFKITCMASARATRLLIYCKGSSGPSHLLCHVRGHWNKRILTERKYFKTTSF